MPVTCPGRLQTLAVRSFASSGSDLVGNQGFNDLEGVMLPSREADTWDAWGAFAPDITGVRFLPHHDDAGRVGAQPRTRAT